MKKILVLLADGFEEIEAIVPIDVLKRAGFNVVLCGINEKKAVGAHNVNITCDITLDSVDCNYDCIILPGGMPGTNNLSNCKCVCELIKKQATDNKLVCAICAAPSILEKLGLLKNRKATSYPNFLNDNETIKINEKVVIDGNIITSQGAGTAFDFAYAIVEKMGLDSQKLKKTMMFEEKKR